MPLASPVLWLALNLPELAQSLVTALITLDRDFTHRRIRGSLRLLDCVAGGAVGLLFVSLGVNSFLWWSVAFIFGLARSQDSISATVPGRTLARKVVSPLLCL